MKKDKSLEDNKLSNIAPKLGRVDTKSALFLVGLSAFLTGGAIAFATFYGRLVVFGEQSSLFYPITAICYCWVYTY